jgi:hypothetical protein
MAGRVSIDLVGGTAVTRQLRDQVQRLAKSIGQEILTNLKAKTPVRTGRARSGWNRSVSNRDIVVENRVPYVPYLEKGTRRMRAANSGRGIIGPALQQSKGKFK